MAAMKTCGPGKIPRERFVRCKNLVSPAGDDTTFEPRGRNAPPGAPVIASMSGFPSGKQPGWNRGIHRYLYPTPDSFGGGDFYTHPKADMGVRYK